MTLGVKQQSIQTQERDVRSNIYSVVAILQEGLFDGLEFRQLTVCWVVFEPLTIQQIEEVTLSVPEW